MADIDDDLLDLAGGDSGDEGSVRSESPPARRATAKKSKQRSRQDDSDEEGEA